MRYDIHSIGERLSYQTELVDLIKMLRAAGSSADLRQLRAQDITRALLHNAADRLLILSRNIDTRPWRTFRQRASDALAVFQQRAVAVYVTGSVYDRDFRL